MLITAAFISLPSYGSCFRSGGLLICSDGEDETITDEKTVISEIEERTVDQPEMEDLPEIDPQKSGEVGMIRFIIIICVFAHMSAKAQRICKVCKPKRSGDIIHRSTGITTAYMGHAAIRFKEQVAEVTSGYDKVKVSTGKFGRALRFIKATDFLSSGTFWGAKRPIAVMHGLSTNQRSKINKWIKKYRAEAVRYDANHLDQKGTFFRKEGGYWEFDCVGFVERLYERLGYNVTPGSDRLITPAGQRDSPKLVNVR